MKSFGSITQRKTGSTDLLLRLFESEFFNEWIAIQYLYQCNQPGVQDYLCNKLHDLPHEAIERYLLQLVYLAVGKPGQALEYTIIGLCSRSFKLSVKVHWLLTALYEDNPKSKHLESLKGHCERAALEGKWDAPFRVVRLTPLTVELGAILAFDVVSPTTHAPNSMSMSMINSPPGGSSPGAEPLKQDASAMLRSSSAISLTNCLMLPDMTPGTAALPVPPSLTISSPRPRLPTPLIIRKLEDELQQESDKEQQQQQQGGAPKNGTHIPSPHLRERIKSMKQELGEGEGVTALLERARDGRAVVATNSGQEEGPATSCFSDDEEVKSPRTRIRHQTYGATLDFIEALCEASSSLTRFSQEERQRALRSGLDSINRDIEAASRRNVAIWFPLGRKSDRVIRLAAKEAVLLTSREKAPFMLFVEVLEEDDGADAAAATAAGVDASRVAAASAVGGAKATDVGAKLPPVAANVAVEDQKDQLMSMIKEQANDLNRSPSPMTAISEPTSATSSIPEGMGVVFASTSVQESSASNASLTAMLISRAGSIVDRSSMSGLEGLVLPDNPLLVQPISRSSSVNSLSSCTSVVTIPSRRRATTDQAHPLLQQQHQAHPLLQQQHQAHPLLQQQHQAHPLLQQQHQAHLPLQQQHQAHPLLQQQQQQAAMVQQIELPIMSAGASAKEEIAIAAGAGTGAAPGTAGAVLTSGVDTKLLTTPHRKPPRPPGASPPKSDGGDAGFFNMLPPIPLFASTSASESAPSPEKPSRHNSPASHLPASNFLPFYSVGMRGGTATASRPLPPPVIPKPASSQRKHLTSSEMDKLINSGCLSPPLGTAPSAVMHQMSHALASLRGEEPLVRLRINILPEPPTSVAATATAAASMPSASGAAGAASQGSGAVSTSASAVAVPGYAAGASPPSSVPVTPPPAAPVASSMLACPSSLRSFWGSSTAVVTTTPASTAAASTPPTTTVPVPSTSGSILSIDGAFFFFGGGDAAAKKRTSLETGSVVATGGGIVSPLTGAMLRRVAAASSPEASDGGAPVSGIKTVLSKFGLCGRPPEVYGEKDNPTSSAKESFVPPPKLLTIRLEVAAGVNLAIPSPARKSRRTPSHEAISLIATKYKIKQLPPAVESGPPITGVYYDFESASSEQGGAVGNGSSDSDSDMEGEKRDVFDMGPTAETHVQRYDTHDPSQCLSPSTSILSRADSPAGEGAGSIVLGLIGGGSGGGAAAPTSSSSVGGASSSAAPNHSTADGAASRIATLDLSRHARRSAPSKTGGGATSSYPAGLDPSIEKQRREASAVFGERWAHKVKRIQRESPEGRRKGWALRCVIVKNGDDCRQEHLALQLIRTFQDVFRESGLPLWVRYYDVLVTSNKTALIEMIPDALSIHTIKHRSQPGMSLSDHFFARFVRGSVACLAAQRKFTESLASYSIITYLLQIKDRHNGNILLDEEGHVIHIDFGFFLSNSPGGVNFESAPFKLTRELLEIMDSNSEGKPSELFDYYKVLMIQGFLACRKHSDRLILLVKMMSKSNLPCFKAGERCLKAFEKRFHLHLTEVQGVQMVLTLISDSLDAWRTRQYDYYQRVVCGIL